MSIYKKAGIAIAVLIIIVATAAIINFFPLLNMSPAETGRIGNTTVYAAKNQSNSLYLVEGEDGYLLIDAGSNVDSARNELDKLGVDPAEIKQVLLTHSDSDHVSALVLFPDAQIYLGREEVQMIDGTTNRQLFSTNSLPTDIDPNTIILVEDNEKLFINGLSVDCIATPGHTPGSMSFLIDDTYLFTGDAAQLQDNNFIVHPFTMDEATAKESLTKLESLIANDHYVFTAHYGVLNM